MISDYQSVNIYKKEFLPADEGQVFSRTVNG